jgi:glycosyltransferase involved in cell wall biosynthesis
MARSLIILPAFDEEAALPDTLSELLAACPGIDVVVVDDGSSDRTAAVAEAAGAIVLRLPFNLGVGSAVRTGLHYAVDQGYERAVRLDADGQHDPADVARLLAALDDGADLAIGSRFAPGSGGYDVGPGRRRAMGALRWLLRAATGRRFADTTSGFWAFGPRSLALLARRYPAEFLADTVEALMIVLTDGPKVVEVPVTMRQRQRGQASTRRFRLVLDYLRLVVGIAAAASRRGRRTTLRDGS